MLGRDKPTCDAVSVIYQNINLDLPFLFSIVNVEAQSKCIGRKYVIWKEIIISVLSKTLRVDASLSWFGPIWLAINKLWANTENSIILVHGFRQRFWTANTQSVKSGEHRLPSKFFVYHFNGLCAV